MPNRKARKASAKRKSVAKLPKTAVTLIVLLRAKEGQAPLLEAELRALIAPTRREEGCLTYDLHRDIETPGAFLLHEVWATRDHHRLHTSSAGMLARMPS
jgi:quinol monooxygenase YgiN